MSTDARTQLTRWTAAEVAILRDNRRIPHSALTRLLPNRTANAIKHARAVYDCPFIPAAGSTAFKFDRKGSAERYERIAAITAKRVEASKTGEGRATGAPFITRSGAVAVYDKHGTPLAYVGFLHGPV